jgi:hypothetical protein
MMICTNPEIYNPAELWFTTTDGRNMRLMPAGRFGDFDTEVFTRVNNRPRWENYYMTLAMKTAYRILPNYVPFHRR